MNFNGFYVLCCISQEWSILYEFTQKNNNNLWAKFVHSLIQIMKKHEETG